MSESVLVTGKRISDMELLANLSGSEKIPTGTANDNAVTPEMIRDYAVDSADLISKVDLDVATNDIQLNVDALTETVNGNANTASQGLGQERLERIAGDNNLNNKVDQLTSDIDLKLSNKVDKDGSVEDVVGLVGKISKEGLSNALGLGTSSTYNFEDLPLSDADKNRFNLEVKPQDFDALGDGTTNDTQAFTQISGQFSGQIIDLTGKTYLVDSLPDNKNTYINGFFKIGGLTIPAKGNFKILDKTSVSPLAIARDGQINYTPRHTLTRANGSGSGSVVQSFCIDHVNRYMYTLTATTPPFVCRYQMDGAIATTALDKTVYSEVLGHQGLDIEYVGNNGDTLIWTSHSAGTGAGGKAVAFKYKPSPEELTEYEEWTLLNTTVSESITPSISFDQKYLLARFQNQVSGQILVRVFSMSDVKEQRALGNFDISNMYLAEFTVPKISINGEESVQDIACDGNFIYILWGTFSRDTDDYIITTDMTGRMVSSYNTHSVGLAESRAVSSPDNQHEPESLCFTKTVNGASALLYGVSYGATGSRQFTMYELGGETPVHKTTKGVPTFLAESVDSLEFAVPTGRTMRFGTYSKASGIREHHRIDYLGRVLRGNLASMQIGGTTNGLQWHSTSTQANAVFGRWASGTSQYPQVMLFKSSSDVVGASVATASGSTLGALSFFGDDGTGTSSNTGLESAYVKAISTANASSGNLPTRLVFGTRSSSGLSIKWEITEDGHLRPIGDVNDIGSTQNPVAKLYSKGVKITNLQVFASNAEALAGGLTAGDVYRNAQGVLMITF